MGGPQSTNQKLVRARGPQNRNPAAFDQTRCLRTFASGICPEWQIMGQDRSVRQKSVRANDPIRTNKMKGAFSLNSLLLGTVRPPENQNLVDLPSHIWYTDAHAKQASTELFEDRLNDYRGALWVAPTRKEAVTQSDTRRRQSEMCQISVFYFSFAKHRPHSIWKCTRISWNNYCCNVFVVFSS